MSAYNQYARLLAELVMQAAALWQGSYDQDAADAALANADHNRQACERQGWNFFDSTDYTKFYRQSLADSCWLACRDQPDLARPVLLLLAEAPNDILGWAMLVTAEPCIAVPYDEAMWKDVPTLHADMPDDPHTAQAVKD